MGSQDLNGALLELANLLHEYLRVDERLGSTANWAPKTGDGNKRAHTPALANARARARVCVCVCVCVCVYIFLSLSLYIYIYVLIDT